MTVAILPCLLVAFNALMSPVAGALLPKAKEMLNAGGGAALTTASRAVTEETKKILIIFGIAVGVAVVVPIILCVVCGCCKPRKSTDGGGAIGRGGKKQTPLESGKVDCRDSMSGSDASGARNSDVSSIDIR